MLAGSLGKTYVLIFLNDLVDDIRTESFCLKIKVQIDKELFLNVPDILLRDIWDKEGIQGLLIGEQETFLAVNPNQVGVPITETVFNGRDIDKGRVSEFLEEFLSAMEEGHFSLTTLPLTTARQVAL